MSNSFWYHWKFVWLGKLRIYFRLLEFIGFNWKKCFNFVWCTRYVLWYKVKITTIVNIHALFFSTIGSLLFTLDMIFLQHCDYFYLNKIKWKKYLLRLLRQILFWILHFYFIIYFFYFMFRSVLLILILPWNRYMLPTQIQGKFFVCVVFFLNCQTCSCLVIQVWTEWINFWQ